MKAKPDHEGALWETTTLLLYELDRPEGAKAILEQSLIPLFPGNELYTEALAAAETLIRRRGPKAMPKDVEEEDSEEDEDGMDMHHHDDVEDRVMDLEDALEELKAEFDELMAGEEHEEEEFPGIHGDEGDEGEGGAGRADRERDGLLTAGVGQARANGDARIG